VAGVGGLARGYHDQPTLTAERFVPNPYAIMPGERLYRTGDLGVYDRFGQIGFAGRADTQAKIRGARVEPAEVEAVLAGHPGVTDCAVLPRRDEQDDNELVAYLTGSGIDVGELAEQAARTLPSFMLPAAYVRLDAFPYTGSGKLDRAALPAPAPADRVLRAALAAEPGSPLERELCRLWASILGVESVGPADDFFAMGGNSLMVTQVMIRLKAAFDVRVPVAEFFDDPTVRGLASLVERLVGALVADLSDDEAVQRMEALGR
jgi:acyl carrier protein